ncbi:hypothetical protein [Streptomyces sp. NBC_01264]|uniref:hypothetical protein n=1 Tax=Streptomyces sp. NBC_01264 TaxID=2903804 RepID=UPI002259E4FB|nr:hypothetical protein [Streptomyces sp. NBC_01264]MCX4776512.1 hypothetical protein [Streptomyces sp. NBC_01264]
MGDDAAAPPAAAPVAAPEPAPGGGDAPAGDARHGLREGLSALRGTRGASGERLDAERDAVSSLRVQAAQVFGGDNNVYNLSPEGAALRSFYRLSDEALDEVRGAFVSPSGFDSFVSAVRNRPLVLLRAPDGSGKAAAALASLDQLGHRVLLVVSEETELWRVKADDLVEGAGLVLADLPQSSADRLTAFELRRLEAQLRARNCRLVITLKDHTLLPDHEVLRDAVGLGDTSHGPVVAESHFLWHLGLAAIARGRQILARPDIVGLLRDELEGGKPLTDAADLGRELADAASVLPDDGIAARVRERRQLPRGQALANWLERMPQLTEQCLAVAVSAFGGEAYEIVAALARDLEDRLQTEESPENPDRPRGTALGGTRTARLAAVHGALVESEVSTRHGGARGKVVRFQKPETALQVLEHVWSEYDEMRTALPEWLRDSAGGPLATVGVRAAVAAGVLTKHAFETVRARILLPWAQSEDSELRDAAATVLGVAARESGHEQAAYNLVMAWSRSEPEYQATAARAWRVVFERDGVDRTWAWMHQLAESEEVPVIAALCQSLTEYIAFDGGRHRRDALDLLGQWISGVHGIDRRLTGIVAFLCATSDLVEHRPSAGPDAGTTALWHTLLAVTESDGELRSEIAGLWHVAIGSVLYELAHEALTDWAQLVETFPRGRAVLATLIGEIASDPRTLLLVRHRAERWVSGVDGRSAPLTGHAVLAHLDGRNPTP